MRTPAGRLRRVLAEQRATVRVNSPVQGCSADITKRTLAELWRTRDRCPGARPILLVHDEVALQVPADRADVARAWLVETMESAARVDLYRVAVKVDTKVGRDWTGTPESEA